MAHSAKRQRLDLSVVERGLAETRSRAQALILAGDVLVNGQRQMRAADVVAPTDEVTLRTKPRFVSRGGEKLAHALDQFGVSVAGDVAVDLGASTGGFTDCLLQGGARRVYAVDVGYGQLDERVRSDRRVVVMERTNARYLDSLPDLADIAVADLSFISLALIFPVVTRLLKPSGRCIPLIKPQFEAGRGDVGKGGVVRDPAIHRRVLMRTLAEADGHGLAPQGLTMSPLRGPAGNIEFLALLMRGGEHADIDQLVGRVLAEAEAGKARR